MRATNYAPRHILFIPERNQLRRLDDLPNAVAEHLKNTLRGLYSATPASHDKYARMTDPNNHSTYTLQEPNRKCVAHWIISNGSGAIRFKDGDSQRACDACNAQPLRPCVRMEDRDGSTVLVFYPRPDRVVEAGCTWTDVEYWLGTGWGREAASSGIGLDVSAISTARH